VTVDVDSEVVWREVAMAYYEGGS